MRALRHPNVFAIAALPLLAVMMALEFLYLRPLTGGQASLDWRFDGFRPLEALSWMTALGPRGRETLLVWHYLSADLFFPILVGLALAGYTYYAARRIEPFRRLDDLILRRLCLLWIMPYLLADYGQNVMVAIMLADPVAVSHSLMRTASVFIILKYAFFTIGILVLAALAYAGRAGNGGMTGGSTSQEG
jgi:hypothetical protein